MTDDALRDLLNEQTWSLSSDMRDDTSCSAAAVCIPGAAQSSVVVDGEARTDGSRNGHPSDPKAAPRERREGEHCTASTNPVQTQSTTLNVPSGAVTRPMSQTASSCSPEELARNYAVDDVVVSLVRWYNDENKKNANVNLMNSAASAGNADSSDCTSCKLEEMLYRRTVSIHCVVARMDMAAKRQVLAAMRQQPHSHDAIIPWLGVSVAQVCTFQLMSKGMPTYAPGEPASERARLICESADA